MMPSAKQAGVSLTVYILHNAAHIELNAIDLTWDTLLIPSRLGLKLPKDFYYDMVCI
jgi:uncharacterized ferritin-like protein (DUF455 family)